MDDNTYDLVDERRHYSQEFYLIPRRLNALQIPITLEWRVVKFEKSNRDNVSSRPGIYAFVVKSVCPGLPPHGYIPYIGITRKRKRNVFLRTRFSEYIRDQASGSPARLQIGDMLTRWRDAIYFYFAEVDDNLMPLHELEELLNDAIQPPKVSNDYSAAVRRAQRAFP
jgi:hypothetical protein